MSAGRYAARSPAEYTGPRMKMSGRFVNDRDVPDEVRSMGRQQNVGASVLSKHRLAAALSTGRKFSRIKYRLWMRLSSFVQNMCENVFSIAFCHFLPANLSETTTGRASRCACIHVCLCITRVVGGCISVI